MNVSLIDEEIKDLTLNVEEGEILNLDLASFSVLQNANIVINVAEGGTFNGTLFDFSSSNCVLKIDVYLNGINSTCNWHSASLSKGDSRKIFDTSVYHRFSSTKAVMSNYGITCDNSKLTFTGISKIENGSKKSKTHQEAKIIVFDELSNGKCSPILKIDENDVEASHAAVVGRVNQEHLFYLLSRGINLVDAKKLITLGYLLPIKNYLVNEDIKKRIDTILEGEFA